MQEQGQDENLDHSRDTQEKGVHGLCLITLIRSHGTEVGDDPEEGVVGMGYSHSTCADGHAGQAGADGAVQSQEWQQGCHGTGRGCKGNGGGPCADLRIADRTKGKKIPIASRTVACSVM